MRPRKAPVSQPVGDFELKRDALSIPMRDGTRLTADLYFPKGPGPWPVLVERTPYDKENSTEVSVKSPPFFASRGYAVVIEDVRGRFKSPGDWYPFRDDGWGINRDGYDTVEWVAAQPWCNGRVGTIGGSYSAHTQYALAPTNPPHLTCQFVRQSVCDYREGWAYRGGAFELGFVLGWALTHAHRNIAHLVSKGEQERLAGVLGKAVEEMASWYTYLPLKSMPLLKGLAGWYYDWLDHPDDGPYWWQWNVGLRHADVGVPICHMGAWFDPFLRGTLDNYTGIVKNARSERARKDQKLIVGPWIHGHTVLSPLNGPVSTGQSKVGEFDFGPEAALDLNDIRLPWFDYWLKDIDTGVMDEPPVRFFTMGINRWQTAESWPPPGVTPRHFYFQSGPSGSAQSLYDGRLGPEPPQEGEGADSYVYDPGRPVESLGGGRLVYGGDTNGPYDQRPVERRCLTYTSEPLREDLEVTGPLTATLYAMSSAPDTDWVVRLTDVSPDGVSRLVADGILRARYYRSSQRPELLTPNQVYQFQVDLWSTSNVFLAGHRIRVAVTSSCFPRWDRNLNTGGPFGTEAVGRVALNTVFRDQSRPSHVTLLVQGEELTEAP